MQRSTLRLLPGLLAGLFVFLRMTAAHAQHMDWQRDYNGPAHKDDAARSVAVGPNGTVYVAGTSQNARGDTDIVTIAYDPDGQLLWAQSYDGGGKDYPVQVATDASGSVYVGGSSANGTDFDYVVLKYASDGTQVWMRRYDSGYDEEATHMVVDGAGNVCMTGTGLDEYYESLFVTVKWDRDGNLLWAMSDYVGWVNLDGMIPSPIGLGVDGAGNIYVGGYGFWGDNESLEQVAYAPDGTQLWWRSYSDPGYSDGEGQVVPYGFWVDKAGNTYVAYVDYDFPWDVSGYEFYVIAKYSPTGNELWSLDGADIGVFSVDDAGNLYYVGSNGQLQKHSPDGDLLWSSDLPHSADLFSLGRTIPDSAGNVYLTGSDFPGLHFGLAGYAPDGSLLWEQEDVQPGAFATDNLGSVYVARTADIDLTADIVLDRYTRQTHPAATVTGVITLAQCIYSFRQPITLEFRLVGASSPLVYSVWLLEDGSFRLTGIPPGIYTLHIKGSRWLAKNVPADLSVGDVSGITATLQPGDINNDNRVTISDLGLLADAFNTAPYSPKWNENADLNGDGKVDILDLELLADNFGRQGDP
jgi:hypothetical protein